MKFRSARLGLAQSLVALSVSLAVVFSSLTIAFASPAKAVAKSAATKSVANQADSSPSDLRIASATAKASADGVLLRWQTNSAPDNVGFNVYRLKDGQRTRVNREIIPGAAFAPALQAKLGGGYSYSWFDRGGTVDATYYIESVSLQGVTKTQESLIPVVDKTVSGFAQAPGTSTPAGANASESADAFEKYYPAAETEINSLQGSLQDQWAIAAQTALKIAIKKDGWYRVTQPQMVAAGFNPAVDIRNLKLFVEAQEVAINTSQHSGTFGNGDYIEFYGRGLDLPTTDVRTYYLIAGTTPGKRVRGQIQLDGDPPPPAPTSTPPSPSPGLPPRDGPISVPVLQDPIFFSWVQRDLNMMADSLKPTSAPAVNAPRETDNSGSAYLQIAPMYEQEQSSGAVGRRREENSTEVDVPIKGVPKVETRSLPRLVGVLTKPVAPNATVANKTKAAGKIRKGRVGKKKKRNKLRRQLGQQRHHAVFSAAAASASSVPPNFSYTAERKDRGVYFVTVLNGDQENFFGQVIIFNSTNPVSQTINTPNVDLAAAGTAQLEIALQGVNQVFHRISVEFNGTVVGQFQFFGFDPASGGHPVQVFNIPVSLLQNGANTIRWILPAGGDVSIVDYVKITYPHLFRADAGALKFMLRGTHSTTVDGFSTSSVKLIDYTDPLNVSIMRPPSAPSGSGFAITVPPSDPPSKPPRLLYAIANGQFDQPAALSLNQPSTINLNSNAADFLIVSHKDFVAASEPLRVARQNQGMVSKVVDVEDIYDEFSFGVHGPQAIRDFLKHAATNWATKPRYVVFAGDACLDPRNYQGVGNFDFVPTKLLDATFNETASDDWLTDFDNDGIGNIPVGRLPVRSAAQATVEISKIVNFAPANVMQKALLVADDHTNPPYYYDFGAASDQLGNLITPSLTLQKVYRSGTSCEERASIIAAFNEGRALVNYLGHGSVDVWAGACPDPLPGNPNHVLPEFGNEDAAALTNGNKLSFVVVLDCLNGYFHDPTLQGIAEALMNNPTGGSVAAFASSGLTLPEGPHDMSQQLYTLVYGGPPISLGDAIKVAKGATNDIDVRTTWIYFGDPSMKIR
jgi:hypothetical protein